MAPDWLRNEALDGALVGRDHSFLSADMEGFADDLATAIAGRRCLFIGAAGSIGLSTLRTVARFRPAAIHVVDHNENGLAEAVRSLRSSAEPFAVEDFTLLPFDYGGRAFREWIKTQSYDYILNFAALKHVRSEKDPYSILAMLETNVLKLQALSDHFADDARVKRVFCVSTDKAANPSSMMGATKRMMEHALFEPGRRWHADTIVTSARFANVALSNGSLLQSWRHRLDQGQPMACPQDCKRYFVTLSEAGHLCTLGAILGQDGSILVPRLNPEDHLVTLQSVAETFLAHQGLTPWFTEDEDAARARVGALRADGRWPVLMTPLDTAGEKPYEEFVAEGETVERTPFGGLDRVPYLPPADAAAFAAFLEQANGMLDGTSGQVSIAAIKAAIARVEAGFLHSHVTSGKSLDQRV